MGKLILLCCMIFIGFFGFKVGMLIVDDNKINDAIQNTVSTYPAESRALTDQVIKTLDQSMAAAGSQLKAEDIVKVRNDSMFIVEKSYDARTHFIGSIDLLVHFEKSFSPAHP